MFQNLLSAGLERYASVRLVWQLCEYWTSEGARRDRQIDNGIHLEVDPSRKVGMIGPDRKKIHI
eukprot:2316940-Rhodomonas_salina.1